MKQSLTSMIAICAAMGLAAPAFADCEQELSELRVEAQGDTEAGISKDGSVAPLEGESEDTDQSAGMEQDAAAEEDGSTASTEAGPSENDNGGNTIAKDGSEAPLDAEDVGVATSSQEAEAQQDGDAGSSDETAESMSQEAQDALARAETALAAGDEAGCMEAVEEARSNL